MHHGHPPAFALPSGSQSVARAQQPGRRTKYPSHANTHCHTPNMYLHSHLGRGTHTELTLTKSSTASKQVDKIPRHTMNDSALVTLELDFGNIGECNFKSLSCNNIDNDHKKSASTKLAQIKVASVVPRRNNFASIHGQGEIITQPPAAKSQSTTTSLSESICHIFWVREANPTKMETQAPRCNGWTWRFQLLRSSLRI